MTEFLTLLQSLSPFVVLAGLGILYFQGRNKDADARIIAAELESQTAKHRADAESRHYQTEEKRLAARAIEDERRVKAEEQTALVMAQTVLALQAIVNTQKQASGVAVKAEKRIVASVEASGKTVGDKIDETAAGLEDFKDLLIMTIDMLMEDPQATRERIKRMQKAWAEGDKDKAQAVADEGAAQADEGGALKDEAA